MDRITSNELEKRVDEVLYYVWDPIGVKHEPFARAEYRSYVPELLALVESENTPEKIAQHLCLICSNSMSEKQDEASAMKLAELLLLHKVAIEKGWA